MQAQVWLHHCHLHCSRQKYLMPGRHAVHPHINRRGGAVARLVHILFLITHKLALDIIIHTGVAYLRFCVCVCVDDYIII